VAVNYLDDERAAQAVAARSSASAGAPRCAGRRHGRRRRPPPGREVAARFGRLDVLVNNAGVFPRVEFLAMEEGDWDYVLDVNLKGTCFCAQAAARRMVAGGSPARSSTWPGGDPRLAPRACTTPPARAAWWR